MRALEEKFPATQFLRVHRSFIVNVGSINSIEDNTIHVKTKDKVKNNIPIGKSYKDNLLNTLNVFIR